MTDGSLLTQFAATRDAEAFAQLVQRHGPMVLTAARRMARDDADDVAQAVFMLLAKKAASLANRPSVAGWLYETTRLCARNANRTRGRQLKHLRKLQETAMATAATSTNPSTDPAWAAELDDALAKLSKSDRSVVLLRYVEGQTLDATAGQLALTPAAVAKRAERALGRLRAFFKARGYQLTPEQAAMGLVAVVPHESISPVVSQAISAGGSTANASLIASGAGRAMVLAKVKLAGVLVASVAAAGATVAVVEVVQKMPAPAVQVTTAPPQPNVSSPLPFIDSAENEAAVRRAIDAMQKQLPEVRIDQVRLEDFVSFMAASTEVPIDVNWNSLAEAGLRRSSIVNGRMRNVRAGRALEAVLDGANDRRGEVSYAVMPNGRVRIATLKGIASSQMVERKYPLGHLIDPKAAGALRDEYRGQISQLVLDNFGHGTWQDNDGKPGGHCHWEGDTLVLWQTVDSQRQARDLFAKLSEYRRFDN